jgi:hypothetical protein
VSAAYWLRKNGVEDIVILEQRGISNGTFLLPSSLHTTSPFHPLLDFSLPHLLPSPSLLLSASILNRHTGATGRNGGHCWPVPHIPPDDWIAKYGDDEMNQIRKFDLENMNLIKQFLESDPKFPDLVEFYTTGGVDAVPKSRTTSNSNEKIMR